MLSICVDRSEDDERGSDTLKVKLSAPIKDRAGVGQLPIRGHGLLGVCEICLTMLRNLSPWLRLSILCPSE
jgi:hypothetical protein